jgi:hypothetical protein
MGAAMANETKIETFQQPQKYLADRAVDDGVPVVLWWSPNATKLLIYKG